MSYEKTMEGVKYLVQHELDMACEDNGERFNSDHEAIAIIHEEMDELYDEYVEIEKWVRDMWGAVKRDAEIGSHLSLIERRAMKAACEAIQVAAMARKAMR